MIKEQDLRIDTYSPGFSGRLWMRLTYIPLGLVVEGERDQGTPETRRLFREKMLFDLEMKINEYHEAKRKQKEVERHAPYDPKDFTSSSWYSSHVDPVCTVCHIPTNTYARGATYDEALTKIKELLRKGNPKDGDGDSLENY